MVGVAVIVTEVPGQKGLVNVEMETPAGRLVLTVIVMMFDKPGLPVIQEADELRRQETWSPLAGEYENEGLFVPTLPPLTFH